jgi:transposase
MAMLARNRGAAAGALLTSVARSAVAGATVVDLIGSGVGQSGSLGGRPPTIVMIVGSLGPFMAWMTPFLKATAVFTRNSVNTAHRIFERQWDEQGFRGGYTIVREYVAAEMLRTREMFVPLSHRPGHAQADFGEADGYIGGKKVRFHYFCVDLPHSDGCFVKAYPAETAEAFCDGHVAAFDFFGGVPQSILYDNTKLAVAKIVKGGRRLRSKMFAELQSHYLFEDRFGRPGKGNDKIP